VLYSPNFEIYDPNAKYLTGPWGEQIARQVTGSDYNSFVPPPGGEKYWTTKYRMEGVFALQTLLDRTATPEIFKAINKPYFLGYYYKNEEESDHVVSVPAMLEFHKKTATPADQKRCLPFPNAGNHVVISKIMAKDYSKVQLETYKFLEEVLGMESTD